MLMIFAVLCLVVFALLSLSTMQADTALSQRSAQAVKDYYEADREAESILAQLRKGQVPHNVEQTVEADGTRLCSYAVPASDTQELRVQVELSEDGIHYNIVEWQLVSTALWEAEEKIPVYTGKEGEENG